MTPPKIHVPRIRGNELADAASTLASAWSRPRGEYPEELWPITLLRRVTLEPTGWLIVEEHFHRDDMYGGTHCVLADRGSHERVLRSTGWSSRPTISEIEPWSDSRFSDGLTTGEDPAPPDLANSKRMTRTRCGPVRTPLRKIHSGARKGIHASDHPSGQPDESLSSDSLSRRHR